MNVLIIGGTRFVGRHVAEAFTARGHAVTLFNRGTNPSVHADLGQIHGDRATDLGGLDGLVFDAVIDMCGYTPDVVERSVQYFKGATQRYVFVSTVSVYDHERTGGPDEDAPLLQLPQGADPSAYADERYGALKVLCEAAVQRGFGERATILRPGLIAGPYDPTDRFTYWPVRFDEGGEVLTPLAQSRVQYIDARDLAAFTAHVTATNTGGIFNCVTPPGSMTFGELCEACMHEASPDEVTVAALSDEFLGRHGVRPWSELPLWIPAASEYAAIANTGASRALAAGMTIRCVRETVRDTLAWARAAEKHPGALKAGLAPEREAELLAAARAAKAP